MTHYQVLELPDHASAADIRRAYRRLVLLTHPDRTPDPAAHARYLAINAAYEVLSIPTRRMAYDALLRQPPQAAVPPVSPGRAREAARRSASGAHRSSVRQSMTADYVRFFRLTRPIMLGALVLCASLVLDVLLTHEQVETVLSTEAIANQNIVIHYTTGGRFTLPAALPLHTALRVARTPLWRTAVSARLPPRGEEVELESLYYGSSNCFWLGLCLAAALAVWSPCTQDQRLMATLTAMVLLLLTLMGLFSA